MISDSLEDIDNRLNKLPQEGSEEDFEEEEDDSGNNILVEYCFGEIYGPNYGIRTLLEFEEECEEGVNCAEDMDVNDDENSIPGSTTDRECLILFFIYYVHKWK